MNNQLKSVIAKLKSKKSRQHTNSLNEYVTGKIIPKKVAGEILGRYCACGDGAEVGFGALDPDSLNLTQSPLTNHNNEVPTYHTRSMIISHLATEMHPNTYSKISPMRAASKAMQMLSQNERHFLFATYDDSQYKYTQEQRSKFPVDKNDRQKSYIVIASKIAGFSQHTFDTWYQITPQAEFKNLVNEINDEYNKLLTKFRDSLSTVLIQD